MPLRASHFCASPNCGALLPAGVSRCRVHAVQREQQRPNIAIRRLYRTVRWARLRAEVLRDSAYTCSVCGLIASILDVDHRVPHNGNAELFWDRQNLAVMCAACHGLKTKREMRG